MLFQKSICFTHVHVYSILFVTTSCWKMHLNGFGKQKKKKKTRWASEDMQFSALIITFKIIPFLHVIYAVCLLMEFNHLVWKASEINIYWAGCNMFVSQGTQIPIPPYTSFYSELNLWVHCTNKHFIQNKRNLLNVNVYLFSVLWLW